MLRNNLKIALRNLLKRKGFTIINSLGLSIGLTSCILIALFVQNQFSYDRFFEDADHIFRMVEQRKSSENTEINSHVPYSFVGTVLNDYPEVETATAIAGPFANQHVSLLDSAGQKVSFLESNVLIADSNFFKVFSFEMLSGDRNSALKNPNSVVLSESTAKRFFGETNPLGKPIAIGRRSSIVTGVCEDTPENSHFKFSYILSSTSIAWFSQDKFNMRYAKCYFKLHEQSSPDELESKFPKMVNTYLAGEIERINSISWEEYQQEGNGYTYFLKPLTSIHLDTEIDGGMKASGNLIMLRVLIAVAVLIFIIACINFMNLSTAKSMERAKEVGVRKVMGSFRRQLIFQFLTESLVISFIGVALAVVLVFVALPHFNTLVDSHIRFPISWSTPALLLATTLFIALIAGLYPAFVLSSYRPINALKGNLTANPKSKWLKNGLVVFQFGISMILTICTLVFQKQIQFLEKIDLGFDKDQLLVIEGTFHMDANYTQPYLEEVRNITSVKKAAGTLWVQGFQETWSDEYMVEGSSTVHSVRRVPIGDQTAEVMNFELLEGELFSDKTDDASFVLLNKEAVNAMGIENPIGKRISMLEHDQGGLEKVDFTIKGVIQNFNYQSLHNEIEPLVIQSNEVVGGRMSYIVVKLDGQNLQQTVGQLESTWKEMVPDRPFNYRFMEDVLDANYKSERKLTTIFSLFSSLSIFIATIGLFALSAYTISLRGKEIGIRKVIGASVNSILILLSKDYVKMVGISFILAIPISWYMMNMWLQDFAYRIDMPINAFIIAGIFGIFITWITISTLAIRAAISNPIDSLNNE